jgi:hypothetical protein
MTDFRLPDLPSDEELGIEGLDEETLLREAEAEAAARSRGQADADPAPAAPKRPPGAPPTPPPPPPPQPGARRTGGPGGWGLALLTLLVLAVGTWASSVHRAVPTPLPANAPDSVFSASRAMVQLVELARAPRPVGTPEHARVRELLVGWLEELGLEVEQQEETVVQRGGGGAVRTARAVTVRNLVARLPGRVPGDAILLTAHYDAVPLSHGAGDDGTGLVAIIEALRALTTEPQLERDVIVLLTDAEEMGLLGARAFVEAHPWMDDVRVVLSAEMRGGAGPAYMFETGARNGWILDALRASGAHAVARSLSVEVYRRLPNDTDFTPFREAGIQGLNFAAIHRAWIYHQPSDRPENIDEGTLQHMGDQLLAVTRELGGRDLASVDAPDHIFLSLPWVGVAGYAAGLALPVGMGLLLLWVGVVFWTVRGGGRWAGVGVGALIGALVPAVGALAGWALLQGLPRWHTEFGHFTPLVHDEGVYLLALVGAAASATLILLGLATRWFAPGALCAGALALPVAAATALSLGIPLAAIDLQLALLGGIVAACIVLVGGGARRGGTLAPWARVLLLLPALLVLAALVPLVEGVMAALSLRIAVGMGALVGVVLVLLLPALGGLLAPNRWWAPLLALIVAGGALGWGALRAGADAERPLPSTLLYALERGEIVEGTEAEPESAADTDSAYWLTREDPGLAWAEETRGPFGEAQDLPQFLLPGPHRAAAAPARDVPAPEVRLEALSSDAFTRVVRISVFSEVGAEIVAVVLPDEGEAGVVALNGRRIPAARAGTPGARRPVVRATHQGEGSTPRFFDVEIPPDMETLELAVVEVHLRPAELLGPEPFRRPVHLQANATGWSDRMVIRTPLTLRLDPPEAELPPADATDPDPPAQGAPPPDRRDPPPPALR